MTTARVLATQEARVAVTELKRIVTGDLMNTIAQLQRNGDILANPNQWDGVKAAQFQGVWAEVSPTLTKIRTDLEMLQQQVDVITQSIMTAGGNSGA